MMRERIQPCASVNMKLHSAGFPAVGGTPPEAVAKPALWIMGYLLLPYELGKFLLIHNGHAQRSGLISL